jgi:hypothetical protein|nr:hypothetical protein [Phenylobacterium sp.]
MLKITFVTAAGVAALVAAALALPAHGAEQAASAATDFVAPAVAVVVDPAARTAVVVPLNPKADVPPEVTATLAGLYATGKVKPGQVVQIVVQRGDKVTEVIANAPIPNKAR